MSSQSSTRPLLRVFAASLLCLGARAALSQSSTASTVPADQTSVAADNSKSNSVDPSNRSGTADQQKNDSSDINITQNIRKSLMADKSLSTYGHNVKVVTVNGQVTLNGVVHSDQERASIEAKAASVVGQGHVVNELKVTPKS